MYNIIFLDIDGVIYRGSENDDLHWARDKKTVKSLPIITQAITDKKMLDSLDDYDLSAALNFSKYQMELLVNLCKAHDAKIVLSSAWRKGKSLEQIKALFSMHEFSKYIIDKTPICHLCPRGQEIRFWVDSHRELVKSFVVLDDISDKIFKALGDRFLYCSSLFSADLYRRAERIFSNFDRNLEKTRLLEKDIGYRGYIQYQLRNVSKIFAIPFEQITGLLIHRFELVQEQLAPILEYTAISRYIIDFKKEKEEVIKHKEMGKKYDYMGHPTFFSACMEKIFEDFCRPYHDDYPYRFQILEILCLVQDIELYCWKNSRGDGLYLAKDSPLIPSASHTNYYRRLDALMYDNGRFSDYLLKFIGFDTLPTSGIHRYIANDGEEMLSLLEEISLREEPMLARPEIYSEYFKIDRTISCRKLERPYDDSDSSTSQSNDTSDNSTRDFGEFNSFNFSNNFKKSFEALLNNKYYFSITIANCALTICFTPPEALQYTMTKGSYESLTFNRRESHNYLFYHNDRIRLACNTTEVTYCLSSLDHQFIQDSISISELGEEAWESIKAEALTPHYKTVSKEISEALSPTLIQRGHMFPFETIPSHYMDILEHDVWELFEKDLEHTSGVECERQQNEWIVRGPSEFLAKIENNLNQYTEVFADWLKEEMGKKKYLSLLQSLVAGQVETFTEILGHYLMDPLSFRGVSRDKKFESFYRGFVAGLIASIRDTHWVDSNKESNRGLYDVILVPKDDYYAKSILLEFKHAKPNTNLDAAAQSTLAQIDTRKYTEILNRSPHVQTVIKVCMIFCEKAVSSVYQEENLQTQQSSHPSAAFNAPSVSSDDEEGIEAHVEASEPSASATPATSSAMRKKQKTSTLETAESAASDQQASSENIFFRRTSARLRKKSALHSAASTTFTKK